MPVSFFIALRYWRAKSADRFGRWVSSLASLGIMLGVAALIIVLSVMNGLESYQKRQVLFGVPHAVVMPHGGNVPLSAAIPPLPVGISKITPINRTAVIFQTAAGVSGGQVIGVRQFADDPLLGGMEGDIADYLPSGAFNLIVGASLAQRLNLQVGSKVRLMITENSQYTPFGRVPAQRLFTVSGIIYDYADADNTAFAALADIGRLMRIAPDQVQGYRLFLDDPFQITDLPAFFPADQWQIADWRSQKGEFFQAVKMEKNMMGLLISLIIVVAVSNIVTSLSLMVVDKQGEIAILQTQGLTKGQVRRIFIWQGLLVALVGTLLGSALGLAVAHYLNPLLSAVGFHAVFLPVEFDAAQITTVVAFSLILALLSTVYPAYRAAKTEPAAALRYE